MAGTLDKPFLVFGMNAIAAYVFAEVMSHLLDHMHTSAGTGLAGIYLPTRIRAPGQPGECVACCMR